MQAATAAASDPSAMDPASQAAAPAAQNGIDLKDALAILSSRSGEHASSSSGHHHEGHTAGCGCSRGGKGIPDQATAMGQTIDLLAPTTAANGDTLSEEEKQKEREKIQQQREERLQRIEEELRSMSDAELLRAVLKAQEDRVATYRVYESGLRVVLDTGNMTSYPDTCAKATASFSVLSETIKTVRKILAARKRTDLVECVDRLQEHEKEKLHTTAASHLERIRAQGEADPRTAGLLEDGAKRLEQRIRACVEGINEVLDEFKCAILDEE